MSSSVLYQATPIFYSSDFYLSVQSQLFCLSYVSFQFAAWWWRMSCVCLLVWEQRASVVTLIPPPLYQWSIWYTTAFCLAKGWEGKMGEVQLAWPPLKFYTRPTKFDTLTWQGLLFKSLVQLPIFTINCINQICVLGTAAVVTKTWPPSSKKIQMESTIPRTSFQNQNWVVSARSTLILFKFRKCIQACAAQQHWMLKGIVSQ